MGSLPFIFYIRQAFPRFNEVEQANPAARSTGVYNKPRQADAVKWLQQLQLEKRQKNVKHLSTF
jgi:hypothetical protein